MWADPEAAAIVFGAGWTVRMIGLDVTLRALATPPVREQMGTFGRLGATLLLPSLAEYHDLPDPAVHDVCAVVSVAVPEVFGYTAASVEVETAGRLTSGMTVTEFSPSAMPNASVATAVDVSRFWDVVLRTYQAVAEAIG
jgi:purine nucleosidase